MEAPTTAGKTLSLTGGNSFSRSLRWFLIPPVTAVILLILLVAILFVTYQGRHDGRIYTGVQVWSADLGGMTQAEAEAALAEIIPDAGQRTFQLVDPRTAQVWTRTAADLGISYDVEATVAAAYGIGRDGGPLQALREQFASWYFGRQMAPIIILDEGELEAALNEIASEVNQPVRDAQLVVDDGAMQYEPGQIGRVLDVAEVRQRLLVPMTDFRGAQVELLIHEVRPQMLDDPQTAARAQSILSGPMTLYFEEPLADLDLERMEISQEQLADWLRVSVAEDASGAHHEVFIDEQAVRGWLEQVQALVYAPPQNARFYFDDDTEELVLVEPHVNGRALDVEATLAQFLEQVGTPNRSLPFVMDEITPTVHSEATAAELGITELITQSTTWFYGSTPERKHNIARAAAQFFGIVIAPGEEFSFNHYLGEVTEEAGFTTGLVIIGGQTVEGVGGGTCQVSTTLYQTAFWAGFPITERMEHGYRVHYYDDGQGPGMDATVFSPIVDLKFVNNTDHYLLIENYYNETYQSLTFKFYSTRVGRRVEKEGPFFENVQPEKPDVWEYNEELEEGEIRKVEWAVEGADVTVMRRVYDEFDNLMYGEEVYDSHYIPWGNVYQYGPGVDPDNVDPDDIPE